MTVGDGFSSVIYMQIVKKEPSWFFLYCLKWGLEDLVFCVYFLHGEHDRPTSFFVKEKKYKNDSVEKLLTHTYACFSTKLDLYLFKFFIFF